MNLLFITDRLHIPHDFSGSVQSTHALILALSKKNYSCKVIASLPMRWRHFLSTILYKISGKKILLEWQDRLAGYPVQRGSVWRIDERALRVLNNETPDFLVLDSFRMLKMLAKKVPNFNKPIALVVHDTFFTRESRELPFRSQLKIIANSPFTAIELERHFGIVPAIISPLIIMEHYVSARREAAKYATLISPHIRKGLDIVLRLAAALPSVPFLLVEGWPMDRKAWRELELQVEALPNVTLSRSTADMRTIYEKTKVLLVPSELETFGRVVLEAQCNGIPALVKAVGALPWVTGAGGKSLAPTALIDEWVSHLNHWYSDDSAYEVLRNQALQNVLREEFQLNYIAESFEKIFKNPAATSFSV